MDIGGIIITFFGIIVGLWFIAWTYQTISIAIHPYKIIKLDGMYIPMVKGAGDNLWKGIHRDRKAWTTRFMAQSKKAESLFEAELSLQEYIKEKNDEYNKNKKILVKKYNNKSFNTEE